MVDQMQIDAPPKREQTLFKLITDKLIKLIKTLFVPKKKSNTPIKKGSILFYGVSSNNQRSFVPIYKHLVDSEYSSIKGDNEYPMVKSLYLSLPYIFHLWRIYRSGTTNERKLIKSSPLTYLFSYGKMKIAYRIMQDYSPALLVMANDHSPMNRCLLHATHFFNIKTLYLQHASVTAKFPKLKFDYALLDGQESFDKYGQTSKEKSKVLLTGATRYDDFYKTTLTTKINKIGISINQFDDFDIVKDLCLKIREHDDLKVIVRPHPNMINWNRDWFLDNGIEYSDSSVESSNEYLNSLALQVSNVCGIHLDAAILGIPTVQFKMSKADIEDHYNYFEIGLINKVNSYAELESLFYDQNDLFPSASIVQYFMASLRTQREGRVGEFTANYIKAILMDEVHEQALEIRHNITVFKF